jgi:hypothetical protein
VNSTDAWMALALRHTFTWLTSAGPIACYRTYRHSVRSGWEWDGEDAGELADFSHVQRRHRPGLAWVGCDRLSPEALEKSMGCSCPIPASALQLGLAGPVVQLYTLLARATWQSSGILPSPAAAAIRTPAQASARP